MDRYLLIGRRLNNNNKSPKCTKTIVHEQQYTKIVIRKGTTSVKESLLISLVVN